MYTYKALPLLDQNNFKIVVGLNPPINPKENTIWVNTDLESNYWMFKPEKITSFNGAGGSAYYWTSQNGTSSSSNWSTDYINIEPNKKYTITKNQNTTRVSVSYWTSDNTWINRDQNTAYDFTFIAPSNCSKIKVWTAVTGQAAFDALDWKIIEHEQIQRYDNTPPQLGDIWIKTRETNSINLINAIKKNAIYIYPYEAYQFNGIDWIKKEAKIYKNNSWELLCYPQYEDQWSFLRTATINSQPVPSDFVGTYQADGAYYLDSAIKITLNIADSYSAKATTYLYFDNDETIEIAYTTDDAGTVTINNELIGMLASTKATSLMTPFKKGWNKVEICYTEGSSGDGWLTNPKFSTLTSVKKMYAKI